MTYQKLEFNGKLYLDGVDRSNDYNTIFKEKPIGKSILDIGCHSGYYSIRAALEGAKKCLGIELNNVPVQMGQKVISKLNLKNVKLQTNNIFSINNSLTFDTVLCLNFVHHFANRIEQFYELLYLINDWAKERIVFTVYMPEEKDKDKNISFAPQATGKLRLRLKPEFFKEYWKSHKVNSYSYTSNRAGSGNRIIVDIIKGV